MMTWKIYHEIGTVSEKSLWTFLVFKSLEKSSKVYRSTGFFQLK